MICEKKTIKYLVIICLIFTQSCGIYSFSGASIPKDAKTISVKYILNKAALVEPNLSNTLTENLTNKCLTETSLNLVEGDADIIFKGKITDYKVQPISIQNNETAAQNRLIITVEIDYINKLDENKNFKKKFSDFSDFNSSENFSNIEIDLNEIIINNLVDDIFNYSFSSW